jgi:alkylation response protein AidB-like acyl-CoA dehydrogenase
LQHDAISPRANAVATEAAARDAAARDADGAFPESAFRELRRLGLVAAPPLRPTDIGKLLSLLAAIGRGDLSVGRIYEGHVNAMLLCAEYGTPAQRADVEDVSRAGGLLGVWNTDHPARPVVDEDGVLVGSKTFSTGIDGLSRALITVPGPAGRLMLLVPLDRLPVDRSWWRPLGMRASGSHVVDFTGLAVEPGWIIGGPDDYVRQPWFGAGAIRFAAVQVGGLHAVFDAALDHLGRTGRAADPFQGHRLARMGIAVQSGYQWLETAASAWRDAAASPAATNAAQALLAVANATRTAVEAAAMAVLEDAERAVGAAGMIAPHPLERRMRDLRTYLRQPNPDGAMTALGAAIASGDWRPGPRTQATRGRPAEAQASEEHAG